jgi:hypothetical protein
MNDPGPHPGSFPPGIRSGPVIPGLCWRVRLDRRKWAVQRIKKIKEVVVVPKRIVSIAIA